MILLDALRRRCKDFPSVYRCACTYICICVCMYACIYSCVYACVCIYVCLCTCIHIHVYTHGCGCTYALVYANFVYLYCPISLLHACVSQVFLQHLHACVGGDWKWAFFSSLFMVSACCWRMRLCFGKGRDRGFVLYFSLCLQVSGRWVGVCLYTHLRTHKPLGYLI